MANIEVQTDKTETKDVPCTYPGCEVVCRVNRFYAPAKARCSEHKGQASSRMRELVAAPAKSKDEPPPEPNRSLADLRCPFDDTPLIVIAIVDSMGRVSFKCPTCYGVTTITPRWSGLVVRSIPEDLRPLAQALNERQAERAAEDEERAATGGKDDPAE